MSWLLVAGLMVVSFLGGLALWLVRLPNCWFLGSIFAIAILGSFGLVEGRVPDVILTVAQVVIGTSIGTQFRHEFLTRLLRLLLASLVTVPYALVSMALVGALCAFYLGAAGDRQWCWRWRRPASRRWRSPARCSASTRR